MNDHISYSQINQLHNCPKSYYYAYVKNLVPIKQKNALNVGRLVHAGMEELYTKPLYTSANLNNAFKRINQEMVDINKTGWDQEDYDNLKYTIALSKALINNYYKNNYQVDKKQNVEVLEIETKKEVRIPYLNSNRKSKDKYVYVSDRVEIINDKHVLVSIKTSSGINNDDINRFLIDTQALTELMFLEKEYKVKFDGILYQIFIKPNIRPKQIAELDGDGKKTVLDRHGNRVFKSNGTPRESGDKELGFVLLTRIETEDEFIKRLEELINESEEPFIKTIYRKVSQKEIDECLIDLRKNNRLIKDTNRNKWYMKNTSACNTYGPCQYLKLCRGIITDGDLEFHYQPKTERV
jgi:hypothetical protein